MVCIDVSPLTLTEVVIPTELQSQYTVCKCIVLQNYVLNIFLQTDPPTIELSTPKIDAVEGQNITLTCTATNDVDSPFIAQITWLGPMGQVIQSNDRDFYISNIRIGNVVTSALKMKPINHKQTGVNKCRATNHPSSSTEMDFTVKVECK